MEIVLDDEVSQPNHRFVQANIQLPIGCLADELLDEIEQMELQRRGDELLEERLREIEDRRREPVYSI